MSAQPAHDTWSEPTWTVQYVFDEEGSSQFAYTIGLHERGLPELHMWSRPPLGDDPAPDWSFSGRDMCSILNDVAWRMLAGTTHVGSEWECAYDAGLVTARFRLDPPGDRDALEAYGIAPDALVLPARWSLHRQPRGCRRPLGPSEKKMLAQELRDLERAGGPVGTVPPVWRHSSRSRWSVNGRYGPRSALVRARAARIWAADPLTLVAMLLVGLQVEQGGARAGWPTAIAMAEGRPLGLDDAVAAVRDDVHTAAHRSPPGRAPAGWASVLAAFVDEADEPLERKRVGTNLSHLFADIVSAVLSADVLGTHMAESTRLAATGPWLAAQVPEGVAPGPAWVASESVVGRLRTVLHLVDPQDLARLDELHLEATEGGGRYAEIVGKLLGWSVTEAAAAPADLGISPALASCLTAAATFRMRLEAEEVVVLTAPFEVVLPGLRRALDEPW